MKFTHLALVLSLGLTQTGCIKRTLLNGQLSATRKASASVDVLTDYELARSAAQGSLAQMIGMHSIAPDNEDLLFMLTKSWTLYGFIFAQDDMETAEETSAEYKYHKQRAFDSYARATAYSKELIALHEDGYLEARKNNPSLRAWLNDKFDDKDDAGPLFWTSYAEFARITLSKDDPAAVAELYIPVALMERSMALDPDYYHSNSLVALGSYHARSAGAEPEEAKKMFELALQKTDRKALLTLLSYARSYACVMQDRPLYDSLLKEVLSTKIGIDSKFGMANTIAQRRARRAIEPAGLLACGFDPKVKTDIGADPDDFMADEAPSPTKTPAAPAKNAEATSSAPALPAAPSAAAPAKPAAPSKPVAPASKAPAKKK